MLREKFSPICFLSALGAGGLFSFHFICIWCSWFHIVAFQWPLLIFYPSLVKGDWFSIVCVISALGIIYFAGVHFKLLVWNIKQFNLYKQTSAYQTLLDSNSEVTLMSIPLTFSMTINVCFCPRFAVVHGLWSVVEYLFLLQLWDFWLQASLRWKIFIRYFSRLMIKGNFDFVNNNSFSQMISIFAFPAVGLAAPGAMSHNLSVRCGWYFFGYF